MSADSPCRTYIVYRHELFAQGLRNVLSREGGVQIVGMENDLGRATKAVRDLHPEVLLVEEAVGTEITWSLLKSASESRIVTFSLDHLYATVYDHHRTLATEPAELVRAIQGAAKPDIPGPDQLSGTGAMADLLESGRTTIPRPLRGKVKAR